MRCLVHEEVSRVSRFLCLFLRLHGLYRKGEGEGGREGGGGHSIFRACIACAAYRGSWLMARRLHATSMHGGKGRGGEGGYDR